MSRAERLATLAKLAGMVEQRGRQVLGQAVSEVHQSRQQRDLLDSYLEEYRMRWLEQGKVGITGVELRRGAAFGSRRAGT